MLMHLPGKITYKEIDEMIKTVDKNEDWKISYSEFRVGRVMKCYIPSTSYDGCCAGAGDAGRHPPRAARHHPWPEEKETSAGGRHTPSTLELELEQAVRNASAVLAVGAVRPSLPGLRPAYGAQRCTVRITKLVKINNSLY